MKKLLIFAISLVALSACYDDKGNYDYHELEEVLIDTAGTGMQAEYAIMRYDSLRIAPNIYFEGALVTDESLAPLDYMWTIYSATTGVGANQVIDTIGYHSVLDTVNSFFYVTEVSSDRSLMFALAFIIGLFIAKHGNHAEHHTCH